MPRHSNWTAPLIEYLAAAARRPFKPGHHDCALFAAGAVAAMTGTDFAAQWRGRYTTLRGGLRVIYYWWDGGGQFWLFTLYDKDEMDDLNPKQKAALKTMLKAELEARQ